MTDKSYKSSSLKNNPQKLKRFTRHPLDTGKVLVITRSGASRSEYGKSEPFLPFSSRQVLQNAQLERRNLQSQRAHPLLDPVLKSRCQEEARENLLCPDPHLSTQQGLNPQSLHNTPPQPEQFLSNREG